MVSIYGPDLYLESIELLELNMCITFEHGADWKICLKHYKFITFDPTELSEDATTTQK